MQDKALGGKKRKCEQLGLDVIHLMTVLVPHALVERKSQAVVR